jgi:L-lactate dehydrogenase
MVRPLSAYHPSMGVCLSVPVVLGSRGIEKVLPLCLSDEEKGLLESSAKSLKEIISKFE